MIKQRRVQVPKGKQVLWIARGNQYRCANFVGVESGSAVEPILEAAAVGERAGKEVRDAPAVVGETVVNIGVVPELRSQVSVDHRRGRKSLRRFRDRLGHEPARAAVSRDADLRGID